MGLKIEMSPETRKLLDWLTVTKPLTFTYEEAHAISGVRVFPVTLTMDDPGVADEATAPAVVWQRAAGPSYDTDPFGIDPEQTTLITTGLDTGP